MAARLQALSTEMADLVAGAAESVLRVEARRRLPATGIAWSDNLIVTAQHVVESDEDIVIGLADGQRIEATLIGRDPRKDLALLQVQTKLTAANWTSDAADLRVGNLVLALGRPRAAVKATLGIVSGLVSPADSQRRRQRRRQRMRAVFHKEGRGAGRKWKKKGWQKAMLKKEIGGFGLPLVGGLIQTDVTMYPGFSGGPLLGAGGEVYGMNTSGFFGGVSVAVPVASIRHSVAALLEHGKIQSGYLGIGTQAVQLPAAVADALAQATGLLIVSVKADSPAAQAGLLVGDIVTALDEAAVEDVEELQGLLARLAVGSAVKLDFVRGGELRAGEVTIGAK